VLRWAIAKEDWTSAAGNSSYVNCYHCDDMDGAGKDTGTEFKVYLPRTGDRDPNVRGPTGGTADDADVIGYIDDPYDGSKVAVTDYLDDKISTIKIWVSMAGYDKDDIPRGWHECDGVAGTPNMKGRFPVGVNWIEHAGTDTSEDDGVYEEESETGGYTWHGKTHNNHSDHEADTGELEHTHDSVGADVQSGSSFTVVGSIGVVHDALFVTHDGPYGPNDYDTDNRPPFISVVFIQRIS